MRVCVVDRKKRFMVGCEEIVYLHTGFAYNRLRMASSLSLSRYVDTMYVRS